MADWLAPLTGFAAKWASVYWSTLRETAPFLVLGLVLAGVLHVLVPARVVLWALGHRGWRGAVRGALVGLPLPLCSCGVVPTALALRRQGASLSAATAFTVATPETSIDALAITAALLPSIFLGLRPLAAIGLAIVVGTVVEYFSTSTREDLRLNVLKLSRQLDASKPAPHCDDDACDEAAEICRVCGLMLEHGGSHTHRVPARLAAIFSYAFGTFFRDIATWVVLGLMLAALLQVVLPAGGFEATWLGQYPSLQVLFAIIAGIPLYSCATATTPLAAVLLTKGLNPGAALALLLAGPATNLGSMFALKRELGGRITFLYYATLLVSCWILGVAFNFAWPLLQHYPQLTAISNTSALKWIHGIPDWLEVATAWILTLLTLHLWGRGLIHKIMHEGGAHAHADSHAKSHAKSHDGHEH